MASPTPTQVTVVEGSSSETVHTAPFVMPATGSNRGLFVLYTDASGSTPTSVTWNGSAMAYIVDVIGEYQASFKVYYIADPDIGEHDVVATSSGSVVANIFIIALQDVAQSSPVDVTASNFSAPSGTSSTPNLTTLIDNDFVLGFIVAANGEATDMTVDTGTELFNGQGGANNQVYAAAYLAKETAGAASIEFSWTGSAHYDSFITSFKFLGSSVSYAISGLVTLSGTPVEGVTVRCIRQSDNTALTAVETDSSGEYLFSDLEEGELYHLMVEYQSGENLYHALSLWNVEPVEV